MDRSSSRTVGLRFFAMALVAVGCVAAVILIGQSKSTLALDELRRDSAELRAQLQMRDRAMATLQADIRRVQAAALDLQRRSGAPPANIPAGMESELIRQITELATLQSNTLALVEKLLVRAEPPEQLTAQQRQAALITLEVTTQEAEQKLEAAKRSAAELLISLNVPADISTLDVSTALDTVGLRAYWPYFEAKRERDTLQITANRVRLRLVQEQIDAGIEAAKSQAP
ncbi:MAG: hypothetical protein DME26_22100 [Verrucomicrobia bacterium]|nr:MAG: hypothetical protein DME26_22100 [Verrucomicrobiota bacterium]